MLPIGHKPPCGVCHSCNLLHSIQFALVYGNNHINKYLVAEVATGTLLAY